jgi:hypothetical protein
VAVVQVVGEVQRLDATKDAKFYFPLRERYDKAFNTLDGWLDSSWRDTPTVYLAAMSDESPNKKNDDEVLVADASVPMSRGSSQTTPAMIVPSGDGVIPTQPAIVTTTAPPEVVQDAEVELSADELLALEAMSMFHDYAYEEWTANVPLGRIGELRDGKRVGDGLPMALVVARTFLDVTNGMIVSIGGCEQNRVPYVQVPDAEACAPPVLPQRIRIRVVHCSHPDTWRPADSWGDGRFIQWARKTTRPYEMLP